MKTSGGSGRRFDSTAILDAARDFTRDRERVGLEVTLEDALGVGLAACGLTWLDVPSDALWNLWHSDAHLRGEFRGDCEELLQCVERTARGALLSPELCHLWANDARLRAGFGGDVGAFGSWAASEERRLLQSLE